MVQSILKTLCVVGMMVTIQACSTTGYSLNEPHLYNNSYGEVMDSIKRIFEVERMVVTSEESVDDDTYVIFFYKKSNQIQEQYYEMGSTAKITIKKLDSARTSIAIKEEKQKGLVRDEYREHLARDVFKGLERLLTLEPRQAEIAESK